MRFPTFALPGVDSRPGYVPDTLRDVNEEQFALVLLDLDLCELTRGSLEFFYPRLSAGAYLIVHDYSNEESDWACKRAFDGFSADKPERLVKLGDVRGSALIGRAS